MELERQLQNLIDEAPKYGVPAPIMEQGVIPVLKVYAEQLEHQEYYIRKTLEDNLVLTVLGNKNNPEEEKKVIYAFPSLKDAANFQEGKIKDPDVVAQKISVSEILFQMFNMKKVDSVIFVDRPNDYSKSKEIYCHKLQMAIQKQLKNLLTPNSLTNNIA